MNAMTMSVSLDSRWELYRLLSDPARLRLLALAAAEELTVGELSELVGQSQPNVSRQLAPLRQAGLLSTRKQGTRTLVRLEPEATADAVVADALAAGRTLCEEDGSLSRIVAVVASRDEKTREFFARTALDGTTPLLAAAELPAFASGLAGCLEQSELAVDAGTGDGVLLDLLAPLFRRVVAVDRSEAQLERARRRAQARGFRNVELVCDALDGEQLRRAVSSCGGADLVMAVRVLHHAPLPRRALEALRELARPSTRLKLGGRVVVLDYVRHEDIVFQERQADVWLGFEKRELEGFAKKAGLEDVEVSLLPRGYATSEIDGHLPWLKLSGRRA